MLQVILRPHVTLQVLEYPLATREYVGITGFYIRASKAIRGRNEACEPSGGGGRGGVISPSMWSDFAAS